MNTLGLFRLGRAGTCFIRPVLFRRTMFEGGPTLGGEGGSTLGGEIDSTLGEEGKSAPAGKGQN